MTCLAHSARVMLISNLWVDKGLVNGAMGTIEAICYRSGGPPDLPVAVMVHFDHYIGPTLHDGTVPIPPFARLGQHLDPSAHDFSYLSSLLGL